MAFDLFAGTSLPTNSNTATLPSVANKPSTQGDFNLFDGLSPKTNITPQIPLPQIKNNIAGPLTPNEKYLSLSSQPSVGTQNWNGTQIPANVSTKNLVAYDPVTGNKTFKLPAFAGGGVYTEDKDNNIVKGGHTTYGGVKPKTGFERADIVPQSLGGTNSNPDNIAYEPLLPKNQQKPGVLTQSDAYLDDPGGVNARVKSGQENPKAAIADQLSEQEAHNFPNTKPPSFFQKVGSALGDVGHGIEGTADLVAGKDSLPAMVAKNVYNMYVHPSDTEQQLEQKGAVTTLPPIIKQVAQAVTRTASPIVEGLGNTIGDIINQNQQANKVANNSGQIVPHQTTPLTPAQKVKLLGNINDPQSSLLTTHGLNGDDYINAITSSGNFVLAMEGAKEALGDKIVNKSGELTVTPEQINEVLKSDTPMPPEARMILEKLSENGQGFTQTNVRPAGGIRQAIGEALGGTPMSTPTQFEITGEAKPKLNNTASTSPNLLNAASDDLKNNPQAGFIDPGQAVTDVKDFIDKTNKNLDASKNLEDNFYALKGSAQADIREATNLVKNVNISPQDAAAIYHYRENNNEPITPAQKEINDKVITPLANEISRIRAKVKDTTPLNGEDYQSRYVQNKGNILDRISEGTKNVGSGNILNKSAPFLKQRTMKVAVDGQGNRQVVAIKGGRVTAFNDKQPTDLGAFKQKSNQQLLDQNIKPLQNRMNTLQKKMDSLKTVKVNQPISQSFIDHITHELSAIHTSLNETSDEYTPEITKGLKEKEQVITEQLKNLTELHTTKVIQASEKPGLYYQYEKQIPTIERRISVLHEKLQDLDVKKQETQVAKSAQKEKTSLENRKSNLEQKMSVLNKIKPTEKLTNIHNQVSSLQTKMIELSNAMGDIESKYNPNELNDKKFIAKGGKEYTIKEATTKEIEQHTNLTYHKNALVNTVVSYLKAKNIERANDFLEAYKESPGFKDIASKQDGPNVPSNWQPVDLQNFRGYVFEPHTANVLDKFAGNMKSKNPGLLYKAATGVSLALRSLIFFKVIAHPLNIAVNWAVDRGVLGLSPHAYSSLIKTGTKAINAVMNQTPLYTDMLRQGAPLEYGNVNNKDLNELLLSKMGHEIDSNPQLDFIKKIFNQAGAINPFSSKYAISKIAWLVDDVARVQRILERMSKGMTQEQAIKETNRFLPDYRLPSSVNIGGKVLVGQKGIQSLTNPNILIFAPYHYGLLKSFGNMAKDLIAGGDFKGMFSKGLNSNEESSDEDNKSQGDRAKTRAEALSKIMMLGLISYIIYPQLDKVVKKIFNNPLANVTRSGLASVINNVDKLKNGNENISTFLQSEFNISPATLETLQQFENRDFFTGTPISNTSDSLKNQVNERAQHAEGIPAPIAAIKGGTGKLIGSLFNVSLPKSTPATNNVYDLINTEKPQIDKQVKDLYKKGDSTSKAKADALIQQFNDKLLSQLIQVAKDNGQNISVDTIKKQGSANFLAKPSSTVMKNYQDSQSQIGVSKFLKLPPAPKNSRSTSRSTARNNNTKVSLPRNVPF